MKYRKRTSEKERKRKYININHVHNFYAYYPYFNMVKLENEKQNIEGLFEFEYRFFFFLVFIHSRDEKVRAMRCRARKYASTPKYIKNKTKKNRITCYMRQNYR